MEVHAKYFLRCPAAAQWLNTPRPVQAVAKEFLDATLAITTTIVSTCSRGTAAVSTPNPSQTSSSSPICPSCEEAPSNPPPCPSFCPRASPPVNKNLPPLSSEPCTAALQRAFPCFQHLSACAPHGPKSLLYVPVKLHDHFVFGVVVGCPVPPPLGVHPDNWVPLVTRFVLDASRKSCLMFSYFAEGSIVVLCDCFDEVGDHFSEITFFEPTPLVGVFPRAIRGHMQVFEKRGCPKCTTVCVSCSCPVNDRVQALVKLRKNRHLTPAHGPSHAASSYNDENVTIQTYPYWAQILDDYKFSRLGSYCVQIHYSPANKSLPNPSSCPKCAARLQTSPYRAFVTPEARTTVEKMIRAALFEKGVSVLNPPSKPHQWEASHTTSVSGDNQIMTDANHSSVPTPFNGLHKLSAFQDQYLVVAPPNIVSAARSRLEMSATNAQRMPAQQRDNASMLPEFESRAPPFPHLFANSGLEGFIADVTSFPEMDGDEYDFDLMPTSTPMSEASSRSFDPVTVQSMRPKPETALSCAPGVTSASCGPDLSQRLGSVQQSRARPSVESACKPASELESGLRSASVTAPRPVFGCSPGMSGGIESQFGTGVGPCCPPSTTCFPMATACCPPVRISVSSGSASAGSSSSASASASVSASAMASASASGSAPASAPASASGSASGSVSACAPASAPAQAPAPAPAPALGPASAPASSLPLAQTPTSMLKLEATSGLEMQADDPASAFRLYSATCCTLSSSATYSNFSTRRKECCVPRPEVPP